MDTQTRHALKQDKFVETTASGIDWLQSHRSNVIKLAALVVVVVALVITGSVIYNSRSEQAQIAFGKARTAALGRRESKSYEDVVKNGRTAFLSVADLTMLEGAVPVIVAGQCVGAVGVSGQRAASERNTRSGRAAD